MNISLDDIIARVNQVAEGLPDPLDDPDTLGQVSPTRSAAAPEALARQTYQIKEFFLPETTTAFIEFAYRVIMGRDPDESGLAHYSKGLTEGASRLFVIGALLRSPEAKQVGTRIRGVSLAKLAFALTILRRHIPLSLLGGLCLALDRTLFRRTATLSHLYREVASAGLSANAALRELQSLGTQLTLERKHGQRLQGRLQELEHTLALYRRDALYRQDLPLAEKPEAPASGAAHPQRADTDIAAYYVAFEDFHRGTEQALRDKLAPYLDILREAPLSAPILDIGCGRGEWLALLQEQGFAAQGVDMNPAMVHLCRQRGQSATVADALSYLGQQPDASLGAITAFHVVEHLEFPTLYQLLAECLRALRPGGLLILETPNPENLLVGAHTFYHDFSHRNPVTPSALDFLARYHGLVDRRILRLHPYPPSDHLPGQDAVSERINGHFYGCQDYALIARKPQGGGA